MNKIQISREDNIALWVLCQQFQISQNDLTSRYGGRKMQDIRNAIAWILKHIAEWSETKIARAFNKNHSTIYKNIPKFDDLISSDSAIKAWFEEILRKIIIFFRED